MATLDLVPGWRVEVERGPDWLFIRLFGDDPFLESSLAEALWNVMQQHLSHRLVLELDEVTVLRSHVIGQLVMLHKRIHASGGLMRLSGLSDDNQDALRTVRLDEQFPHFTSRQDAVMGHRPSLPR